MGMPSYDLKLDWAEQHLDKLERAIGKYSDRHPYTIAVRMKHNGKGNVVSFEFTEQPGDDIALIAGDFLYNVRASLDHIAGCIVPAKRRGRANYPVFRQGVWEPSVVGEDKQRTIDRTSWFDCTNDMADDPVAIIKANQPPDLGPNVHNPHTLAILNRLRNKDAHAKLTVVSEGLIAPYTVAKRADGTLVELRDTSFGNREALQHGAPIDGIPDDVVEMQISGTAEVFIRAGLGEGAYSIRETFRPLLLGQTRTLIDLIRPFDRVNI